LERSRGGLGIGLSLVQRLVELHGGSVNGHSAGVGKGSEFTVRLPVADDQLQPAKSQEPGSNGYINPTTARRILVVDDSRISADSLAKLLRLMGNEVQTAYDGLAAMEAAERFRPDVVLLDIGMPKLNGYEVCDHIRAETWGKEIVLIAVTGWGQRENERHNDKVGFDGHMVKPVDADALLKLLDELQPLRNLY
jgi:CheY-like chemotaxis protein